MELITVVAVLLLLATPIATAIALAWAAGLRRSMDALESRVRTLQLRIDSMTREAPHRAEGESPATPATPARPATAAPPERPPRPPRPAAPAARAKPLPAPTSRVATPPTGPAAPPPPAHHAPRPQRPPETARSPRPARPAATAAHLEAVIGTTWVLRVGLVVLAVALALFARTVAPHLPPGAKVAVAYVAAIALYAIGRIYAGRLQRFARPVMAGGLAFGFFVAYAAYFVPAMRAIPLLASALWMGFGMVTLLVAADRWRSQATAVLAFLLGHVSAYVAAGRADTYSLVILASLAVVAAVLMLRYGWLELGLLGVALSYLSQLLWILAERGPVDGDPAFWVNLAFLTTYYATFLVADVLWWRRAATSGTTAAGAFASPRHIGPINLMLYVSMATFVYRITGAHLDSIEWFYITIGALQGAVAWFYWHLHNRDYVFYPAFGTILWTLGMFAALDALSLSLVLAGQAFLLLVTARRTRLWIFHALAQAAFAVSFVHYWLYPRPAGTTWVAFLGGVGILAIYLITASLEEMWYDPGQESRWWDEEKDRAPVAARAFRAGFRSIARLLAPLHATLAAAILLREAVLHFGLGTKMAASVAVAGLAVVAVVLLRRRTALLWTSTTLAGGALLLVPRIDVPHASVLLVAGLATATLPLVGAMGRRLRDRAAESALVHVQVMVAAALFGAVLASGAAAWEGPPPERAWLLVPVLALLVQELISTRSDGDLPQVLSMAAGALVVRILWTSVGVVPAATVWVAGGTAVLMSAAAARRSRRLFAAGYVLMALGYYAFLSAVVDGTPIVIQVLGVPWMGALVSLVPLGIAIALDRLGRDGEWLPDRFQPKEALAFVAYATGFALAGTMARLHLYPGSGWAEVAAAGVGAALVASAGRLRTPLMVPSVVAGLVVLHVMVLGRAAQPGAWTAEPAPLVIFGVLTLVAERLVGWVRPGSRETSFDRGAATMLVALAASTMMAAAYRSPGIGPTWTTAGWSVIGGSLMAAGFVLASALHRRVALAVLALSLVRVLLVDTRELSDTAKIGAFFVLGVSLVGVAWLYAKYQARVKEWF